MKTVVGTLAVCLAAAAFAQDADRVVVPSAAGGKQKLVKVSVLSGNITVQGYQGSEVVIEARPHSRGNAPEPPEPPPPPEAAGMHRLRLSGNSGLNVRDEDDAIVISALPNRHNSDLFIQVPFATPLSLHGLNSGRISVERVNGEVEADMLNGGIRLVNVSGAVVAHTLNGEIRAEFDRVPPDKAMSFSTLNGSIDVTFPADLRANVKIKADNGEVFTDFDVKLAPNTGQSMRLDGNHRRATIDKNMTGTINGGGPELQFRTLNGKIYIRKRK